MSSSNLANIQSQLTFYGYSICMILGNLGNLLVVILFSQKRLNACSIYLISSVVISSVYLTFNGVLQIYPFDYHDQTLRAIILCKLRQYLPNVLGQVANTMLILACIDRFLITSDRADFRAFSTPKRALWLVFFSIVFWSLFCCHVPIMSTVLNGQCSRFGIYSTIYTMYTIVFIGLLPPIILTIFAFRTYHNMRRRHLRIQPVTLNTEDGNNTIHQRDRQLLILVLSEVVVYVMTTALYPMMLLEIMISQYINANKSIAHLQIEGFIITMVFILLLLNSSASFYIYLIVSRSFRQDVRQLIGTIYRKLRRQPTNQIAPGRTHQSAMKQDTHL